MFVPEVDTEAVTDVVAVELVPAVVDACVFVSEVVPAASAVVDVDDDEEERVVDVLEVSDFLLLVVAVFVVAVFVDVDDTFAGEAAEFVVKVPVSRPVKSSEQWLHSKSP